MKLEREFQIVAMSETVASAPKPKRVSILRKLIKMLYSRDTVSFKLYKLFKLKIDDFEIIRIDHGYFISLIVDEEQIHVQSLTILEGLVALSELLCQH